MVPEFIDYRLLSFIGPEEGDEILAPSPRQGNSDRSPVLLSF